MMQTASDTKPDTWEFRFVTTVFERCAQNKGLAARLRRADNPALEYQSWDLIASLGVDLEKDYIRVPFVTVAAAIAKSRADKNGSLSLGRAISQCYEDGRDSDQAKARLRRLLACDDIEELSRIVRPLFSLIQSKVNQPLDYVRLLRQIRFFSNNSQSIKTQWAQEFYGRSQGIDDKENN